MSTRSFKCALASAGALTVFALLSPSLAWAHRCGLPQALTVNKGSSIEYRIPGYHPADYEVVDLGNIDVATVEPTKIKQEYDGVFKLTGVGKGTTTIKIEWEGPNRKARCDVDVTVID